MWRSHGETSGNDVGLITLTRSSSSVDIMSVKKDACLEERERKRECTPALVQFRCVGFRA